MHVREVFHRAPRSARSEDAISAIEVIPDIRDKLSHYDVVVVQHDGATPHTGQDAEERIPAAVYTLARARSLCSSVCFVDGCSCGEQQTHNLLVAMENGAAQRRLAVFVALVHTGIGILGDQEVHEIQPPLVHGSTANHNAVCRAGEKKNKKKNKQQA
jgi:hypothetical protein